MRITDTFGLNSTIAASAIMPPPRRQSYPYSTNSLFDSANQSDGGVGPKKEAGLKSRLQFHIWRRADAITQPLGSAYDAD